MTADPRDAIGPAGNVFDKYGTSNPAAQMIVRRFRSRIDGIIRDTAPASMLDVGCGEGVLTEAAAGLLPRARVVGVDLPDPGLRAEWGRRAGPSFVEGSVYELPFGDGEFELVSALEVLEHLERPAEAVRELARVSGRWLLVSVPLEPLWRVANVLTGRYVASGGNTPGHVQHFSRSAVTELIGSVARVVSASGPLPWTIVLARVD